MLGLTHWVRKVVHRTAERRAVRPRGCRACGSCCELYGGNLRAARADLERWRSEGRGDLLERVGGTGRIWLDPATKRPLGTCPFLEKRAPRAGRCAVHETKPEMCRSYPTLAHGKRCVRGVIH